MIYGQDTLEGILSNIGVKQGDKLSPLLFNIDMYKIATELTLKIKG